MSSVFFLMASINRVRRHFIWSYNAQTVGWRSADSQSATWRLYVKWVSLVSDNPVSKPLSENACTRASIRWCFENVQQFTAVVVSEIGMRRPAPGETHHRE
jgi:hypothetical protein